MSITPSGNEWILMFFHMFNSIWLSFPDFSNFMSWYLVIVLIYNFLMINGPENLFTCLAKICIFIFGKEFVQIVGPFLKKF